MHRHPGSRTVNPAVGVRPGHRATGWRETGVGLVLGLLLMGASSAAAGQGNLPVRVSGGLVQGRLGEAGDARIFEGIPFAAPPLGDRRWRPPAPVIPWTGIRKVDKPAPACMQNDYGWNRANHLFASEDCLTLDVRAPMKGQRLPVMVWIHGGSNRAGGAGGTVSSRITEQGVVLVAVQYRLGIFGFLAHRELAAEQAGASGNYGLMDQIAALLAERRWPVWRYEFDAPAPVAPRGDLTAHAAEIGSAYSVSRASLKPNEVTRQIASLIAYPAT